MKYGIQITTTEDGAWSVSQLVQKTPDEEFTRTGGIIFVDHSLPHAQQSLLDAVERGLRGQIVGTSDT